jgi:parallel beta-helix repeat protein
VLAISLLGLYLFLNRGAVTLRTLTVDDDGTANFSTIEEAINAANPGDTIQVASGTYNESYIEIKKALTLSGENKNTTIIDGKGLTGAVIAIKANNVNISGFTIRNAAWGTAGIYMGDALGCVIRNTIIASNVGGYGISLFRSSNNNVSDNIITSNERGIDFSYSSNNIVHNNTISNNVDGIYLSYDSTHNTFTANTMVNNSYRGFYCYSFYGEKPCGNNTLIGNTIADSERGVHLESSNNNTIYHNNFINNTIQVMLMDSTNSWDNGYPSGGNYWSEHTCIGNPSDGSHPYTIDADDIDRYPFQDPNGWSS